MRSLLVLALALLIYFSTDFKNGFAFDLDDSSGLKQALKLEASEKGPAQTYIPSPLEDYVVSHAIELGLNVTSRGNLPSTCAVWNETTRVDLNQYLHDLDLYNALLANFTPLDNDIRSVIRRHPGEAACKKLILSQEHGGNLDQIFKQASFSPSVGILEPLLPPLRHPKFCHQRSRLMDLSYLVHDFAFMCKNLKPSSRTVFIDMGASLEFHGRSDMPAMYILSLYRKFGFYFDHIYAFEVTPIEAAQVYAKVPSEFMAAYHWINVGVGSDPNSRLNPLKMLVDSYNEDDFVVVKLDIDTSSIEVPLAHQLLEDDRYSKLVDQFYFEHHVFLKELGPWWGRSMSGSVYDSFHLFQSLRKNGIAAHSWV